MYPRCWHSILDISAGLSSIFALSITTLVYHLHISNCSLCLLYPFLNFFSRSGNRKACARGDKLEYILCQSGHLGSLDSHFSHLISLHSFVPSFLIDIERLIPTTVDLMLIGNEIYIEETTTYNPSISLSWEYQLICSSF